MAYQGISGPRRALAHGQIATALQAVHDPDSLLAGDILHHASLGGQLPAAAEAAARAGERCACLPTRKRSGWPAAARNRGGLAGRRAQVEMKLLTSW